MSVPLLEANYIQTMRQLEAQARENEKRRQFESDQNLKQFGQDIGKALLTGGINIGGDAFKNYLTEPLELAKEGAYIPEALKDNTRKAALEGLKGKLLGDGGGIFGSVPKPPVPPASAPAPVAPAAKPMLEPDIEPLAPETPAVSPAPKATAVPASAEKKMLEPDIEPLAPETPAVVPVEARPLGSQTGPSLDVPKPPPVQWQERKPEDYTPGKDTVIIRDKGVTRTVAPGPSEPSPPQGVEPAFKGLASSLPEPSKVGPAVTSVSDVMRSLAAQRAGTAVKPAWETREGPDLSMLSPRERGLYEASQSILAQRRADAAQRTAAAGGKPIDTEMRDARLAKINAEIDLAKAKAEKVNPTDPVKQAQAQEEARTKAWIEVGKLSKNIEKRTSYSSSGTRATGLATGGIVINMGGGGSSNDPIFRALVVADERGFPVVIGEDANRQFVLRQPDGSVNQYFEGTRPGVNWRKVDGEWVSQPLLEALPGRTTVDTGKADQPVSNAPTGRATARPAARPVAAPPVSPKAPVAPPVAPPTDALDTARQDAALPPTQFAERHYGPDHAKWTPKQKNDVLMAEAVWGDKALPAGVKAAAMQEFQNRVVADATTAQSTATEAAKKAEQAQVAARNKFGLSIPEAKLSLQKARRQGVLDLYGGAEKFVPTEIVEGDAGLSEDATAAALQGVPLPAGGLGDAASDNLYEATRKKALAAMAAAENEWILANLPTLRDAYRAAGYSDGQFYDTLKSRGLTIPQEKRPSPAIVPPGPAETSPGQFPPPGQQSAVSPAEDLFNRIQAQPWSVAKKRRVFLATAARDGIS